MKRYSARPRIGLGIAAGLASAWLLACAEPSAVAPGGPSFGASTASSSDPTVNGVKPDNAPQDTTLDVEVFGSNFDRGSQVQFLLGGVATAKVVTNSTRFASPKKLIANITITMDADTGLYDVQVMTTSGRKGIGIEMFRVRPKWENRPNYGPAITEVFRDASTDNIRSDRRVLTGDGRGLYVDRECGVSATFNLTDARLDPDAYKIAPSEATACGGRSARGVMVAFTDLVEGSPPHHGGLDGQTVKGNFMIVGEVEPVTVDSGAVLRGAVIHGVGCPLGLRFMPGWDPQSNFVQVAKNLDGTWTIWAAAPNDVAVCVTDDSGPQAAPRSYYHMPFQTTVRIK